MSSKAELHRKLREIGYQLGSYASKDTLSIVMRLHSITVTNKDINVANLNDLELRKSLTQRGFLVGPVTSHTRAIYQRKLLEVLTNETSEGQDDEFEIEELTNQENITSSPTRTDRNTLYPNLFDTKPVSSTVKKPFSSQDIRHGCYATPSSKDTVLKPSIRNTYGDSNLFDDPVGIRPRTSIKPNERKPVNNKTNFTPKKVAFDDEPKDNLQVATKTGGTFLYAGITIVVAIIVFIVYLWLEK